MASDGAYWMAEVLIRAEARGHRSHCLMSIPQYDEAVPVGEVRLGEEPFVTRTATVPRLQTPR